ncbi:MAG: SCO family protein [Steroidobacteraceae bacterium]
MELSRRRLLMEGPMLLGFGMSALAQQHDHSMHAADATAGADEHAAHRAMMTSPAIARSEHDYAIPKVQLRTETGGMVELARVLATDQSVVLNFIYTSCTTICPVMTASLVHMQHLLAGKGPMPSFVSISVDPDFDSPQILKAYAAKSGARWTFLTGTRPVVMEVLRQFDVWRGSKANHAAVTLLRKAGAAHWTRIEGLASAEQLAEIWTGLHA